MHVCFLDTASGAISQRCTWSGTTFSCAASRGFFWIFPSRCWSSLESQILSLLREAWRPPAKRPTTESEACSATTGKTESISDQPRFYSAPNTKPKRKQCVPRVSTLVAWAWTTRSLSWGAPLSPTSPHGLCRTSTTAPSFKYCTPRNKTSRSLRRGVRWNKSLAVKVVDSHGATRTGATFRCHPNFQVPPALSSPTFK